MGMAKGAYKSSKQALAWFFEKSRDKWKMHCRGLRKKLHVMAVHVADATRARDGRRSLARWSWRRGRLSGRRCMRSSSKKRRCV